MVNQKSRTIGRSFRINEQWLKALGEEAEKAGISPNALINKILQEYFEFYIFVKRVSAITLSPKDFSSIIDACPKEALTEIAKKSGSDITIDLFRATGRRLNYEESINWITRIVGEYANWYKCEHYNINNKEYFHFRHNLGEKWSIYIAEAASTLLESVCNKKVKKEFLEGAVTLELSLSPLGKVNE